MTLVWGQYNLKSWQKKLFLYDRYIPRVQSLLLLFSALVRLNLLFFNYCPIFGNRPYHVLLLLSLLFIVYLFFSIHFFTLLHFSHLGWVFFWLISGNRKDMSPVSRGKGWNGVQDMHYPAPLASHDDVAKDPVTFWDTLRRFHFQMNTKFMWEGFFISFFWFFFSIFF